MTDNQNIKPINLANVPTFSTHFNKYIANELRGIEEERKRAVKLFLRYSTILIISMPLALLLTAYLSVTIAQDSLAYYITPLPPLAVGIGILILFTSPIAPKNFKQAIKEKLLNKLFSYLGDFSYQKEPPHDTNYFRNIKCLESFIQASEIDDCIRGNYKGIPVEINEFKLTDIYIGDKPSKVSIVNSDRLLLLSLPQIKKIKTNLIIRNKKFYSTYKEGEDIILEDVKFNKIYSTIADDQIEARYMLTPTFIEYLKDLDAYGITVNCIFQDEQIYIALPTFKDMFEPPFFKSALNVQAYREIIEQLERILKIIDILKLDNDTGL